MQTETIHSSNQSHALYHTFFDPVDFGSKQVKATLLILHGLAEHSDRYAEFAQFLATQGIAVATYDQLGHGKTAKSEEELGFFDLHHPVQCLLKDTIIMANVLKQRHPAVPHFLMGHSMGSFVVRNILKHHSQDFAGAVLMGTDDKDFLPMILSPMFTIMNKISPNKRSSFGSEIINKRLNSKVGENITGSESNWISENPENIKAFEADLLCGFDLTNNGCFTLAGLMNGALNSPWYEKLESNYPLKIVSGKNDPVGNMGKSIDTLVKRLHRKGLTDISKTLYPNMRHEPLHEIGKQMVYDDISIWLLSKA